MKCAVFDFDQDLLGLLPAHRRKSPLSCSFSGPQSAKHLIEAVGIPHTEVGGVLAAGEPADLAYLVHDGDWIEVRGSAALEPPHSEPRFVIDGHLGRLAAWLRMLGLDCRYAGQIHDDTLYHQALSEQRYLLTRDRRLLMRKGLIRGCLVRSREPQIQLEEVWHRYGLVRWASPFHRCMQCNAVLEPVAKDEILDKLEPRTRIYFSEFRQCPSCHRIYWKGSHYDRMQATIERLLSQTRNLHSPDERSS